VLAEQPPHRSNPGYQKAQNYVYVAMGVDPARLHLGALWYSTDWLGHLLKLTFFVNFSPKMKILDGVLAIWIPGPKVEFSVGFFGCASRAMEPT
jgi:hypothetical protein